MSDDENDDELFTCFYVHIDRMRTHRCSLHIEKEEEDDNDEDEEEENSDAVCAILFLCTLRPMFAHRFLFFSFHFLFLLRRSF